MRFRLGNSAQGAQAAGQGIGNLFASMAMAPMYAAQAGEEAQTALGKRQLMESQVSAHQADAAIKQQEAQALAGRGDAISLMSASRAGMSVPEFTAAKNERLYGAPMEGPPMLTPAIEGMGPSGRTANFDNVISMLYAPAMASPADKTNFDQIAKARGEYQTQDVLSQVISGRTNAGQAGQAVAASKGTKLIENIGNTGDGFNQFTGAGQTISPGVRALYGDKVNSEVQQNKAQAGAAGALAGLRGVQTNNAKVQGGLDALDFAAAQKGEPLPSTNKASRGSDSTNAKFRNQVILAAMKKPEFASMNPDEKQQYINTDLLVSGMDPIEAGELAKLGGPAAPGKPAGKGSMNANAATSGTVLDAPTEPAKRKVGSVYKTPKGNLKWTGTGWLPEN